jgi:ATP-dependent Clp protease protease subunit
MLEQFDDTLASLSSMRPKASGYESKIREWIKANAEHRAFNATKLADGVLEMNMLDVIGEDWWTGGGITANRVKAQLDQNKDAKTIKVLMNSPGGDAFEGLAIQSLLKRTGARIEIEVIGLAASAATVISMAGDSIAIHEGALFMIHEAWTFAMGTKRDMRQVADFLEKVDGSILDIYARRTGRPAAEITPLVEATTWMTAHEAVAQKFATSVIAAKSGGDKPAAKASATRAPTAAARRAPMAAVPGTLRPKNGEGPSFEVGDRIFAPEPYEPGHTVGEVREAVLTYVYGAVMDGFESDGVYHWYVESELVPEADRAAFEEPNEPARETETRASAKPGKPPAMSESNESPDIVKITVETTIPEITDEERDIATKAASDAAARAVVDKREEERRIFMATNPLARAGKPPAPPFGGLRNK